MGLQLQSAITTARSILNDEGVVTYTEPHLLDYANGAVKSLVALKPQLFYERGNLTCVAGEAAQSVSFTGARSLVSVDRIVDGSVITQVDKVALDRFKPSWPTDTAAAAVHWMSHADSPVRFYIYPPAPVGQVLEVTYVKEPSTFVATDDTGLPVDLAPAIADYIVAMAMMRDDEHVLDARAQAALTSFAQRVKGA